MRFPYQPLERRKNRQKKQNNEHFEWNEILWLHSVLHPLHPYRVSSFAHFLSPLTLNNQHNIGTTELDGVNEPGFIFRSRKPPVSLSTAGHYHSIPIYSRDEISHHKRWTSQLKSVNRNSSASASDRLRLNSLLVHCLIGLMSAGNAMKLFIDYSPIVSVFHPD